MAVSLIKEKRNLIILVYIPILYMAYNMSVLSFKAYTFFFIVGMSCVLAIHVSKNTKFKDILFSLICGISLFLVGFLLYEM